MPDGSILDRVEIAPAEPPFESAFAAMGAGCMIATPTGSIAAIDLMPGTTVCTAQGATARVLWVGSVTIHPAEAEAGGSCLFRVVAGAFGPQTPETDLLLGQGALLATGPAGPLERARDIVDGDSIIATRPISPVSLHQVVLDRPGLLKVSGLYLAPGKTDPGTRRFRRAEDRRRFAELFAGLCLSGMNAA
ncbi:Hint domain-containing protein [Albidovulum inexpectatum]|uniref:Hint domain-containing protein n=1 Tax=Albidovulum inexpectatum TaxID=196587 RepID=UPI0014738DB2|nr:Hint domain-containing protein [Albidovulum inexpectatum]